MIRRLLAKNELLRHTVTLMTGTVIAQAIPLAISPILTRLYSPEEFGVFALFIAIIGIFSVVVTTRYEFAIMQPEKDSDAFHIVVLSLMVSVTISLVCFAIVVMLHDEICNLLNNKLIGPWLYCVPLSVLIMGCFQSFNYWNNRQKKYKSIAKSKVCQSIATVSINVSANSVQIPSFGLIAGHIVGQVVSALVLSIKFAQSNKPRIDKKRIFFLAKKYSRFPAYSTPGALVNSLALQLPVLVIARVFDIATVGYFNFVYRIIGGPMSLIAEALSQVLLQKIASKDYTSLHSLILLTASRLFFIALPMVLVINYFGTQIFGIIFGESWKVAGEYSKVLIYSIAIRFIVSPLSMVLLMERFIKWAFCWQMYTLFSVLMTVFMFRGLEFDRFIVVFVVQDVVSYLIYFGLIIRASKTNI